MRRSKTIKLVLLSSTALLLSCDQEDPLAKNGFVADQTECSKAFDADMCRQKLADARAEHMKSAPAFPSKDACEEQFGVANCEPQTKLASAATDARPPGAGGTGNDGQMVHESGTGMFVPMMMGMMMGRMMGGGYYAQPVYRDASNTAYAGGSGGYTRVGSFDNRMSAPPSRSSQVAARGGFGQEGAARSAAS